MTHWHLSDGTCHHSERARYCTKWLRDSKQSVIDLLIKRGAASHWSSCELTIHPLQTTWQVNYQIHNLIVVIDQKYEKKIDQRGLKSTMQPIFTQLIPSLLNPTHVRSFVCSRRTTHTLTRKADKNQSYLETAERGAGRYTIPV